MCMTIVSREGIAKDRAYYWSMRDSNMVLSFSSKKSSLYLTEKDWFWLDVWTESEEMEFRLTLSAKHGSKALKTSRKAAPAMSP